MLNSQSRYKGSSRDSSSQHCDSDLQLRKKKKRWSHKACESMQTMITQLSGIFSSLAFGCFSISYFIIWHFAVDSGPLTLVCPMPCILAPDSLTSPFVVILVIDKIWVPITSVPYLAPVSLTLVLCLQVRYTLLVSTFHLSSVPCHEEIMSRVHEILGSILPSFGLTFKVYSWNPYPQKLPIPLRLDEHKDLFQGSLAAPPWNPPRVMGS